MSSLGIKQITAEFPNEKINACDIPQILLRICHDRVMYPCSIIIFQCFILSSRTEASLMLVLEYAPYGNLLGYLRKSRGLVDKFYCSSECCQPEVTPYDLLSFAQQIASGMSFLASRKVRIIV